VHYPFWDFHPEIAIQQDDMQIGPPSAHENQPSPYPAALGEEPSPGFPADSIQWSALNTDHLTWTWGWAGFSLLLFLKVTYGELENLSVGMDMSERNSKCVWQFIDQDSLCLLVSIVRCSWWSLGRIIASARYLRLSCAASYSTPVTLGWAESVSTRKGVKVVWTNKWT
jgi:hypothetical protein